MNKSTRKLLKISMDSYSPDQYAKTIDELMGTNQMQDLNSFKKMQTLINKKQVINVGEKQFISLLENWMRGNNYIIRI